VSFKRGQCALNRAALAVAWRAKKLIFYQFITVMHGFDWMGAMGTKRVRKS
jgi:hypothetical protein